MNVAMAIEVSCSGKFNAASFFLSLVYFIHMVNQNYLMDFLILRKSWFNFRESKRGRHTFTYSDNVIFLLKYILSKLLSIQFSYSNININFTL